MDDNKDNMFGSEQEGERRNSYGEQPDAQFSLLTLYKQQIVKYEKEIEELKRELSEARKQNGTSGHNPDASGEGARKHVVQGYAEPKKAPTDTEKRTQVRTESKKPASSNKTLHIIYGSIIVIILLFAFLGTGMLTSDHFMDGEQKTSSREDPEYSIDSICEPYPEIESDGIVEDMEMHDSILGTYRYTGRINSEGMPNGKGQAAFSNGDTFDGTFVGGELFSGRYTWAEDGGYFEGSFVNCEPDETDGYYYDKNGKRL